MRFIYLAKNLLNGKCYVGQTKNFEERVKGHLREADVGRGYAFHSAIRKYGKENFVFEIIDECNDDVANERERIWIERFDSFKRGYNLTSGGDCFEFSEETIQKIKDANSNVTDETRYARGSAFRGKHLSEEHKQKLHEANKGKIPPCYEETRRKRSESMKGKNTSPKSEEHRRKLSEARKKWRLTEEQKAKINANRKPVSEETRQKLSEAGKGRVVSEETRRKKSKSMKGKKFKSPSLEVIERRAEKNRGKKRTEEQRKRMSEGKKRAKEEREKKIAEESQKELQTT